MKPVISSHQPTMFSEFTKRSLASLSTWHYQKTIKKTNNLIIIHLESRIVLIGMKSSLIMYPMIPIMRNPMAQDFEIWMYSFFEGFSHLLKNLTQSSKNSKSSLTLASTTFVIYNYNTNYFVYLRKMFLINLMLIWELILVWLGI